MPSTVSDIVQEHVNKTIEQAETLLDEAAAAAPEKAAELRAKAKKKLQAAGETMKQLYQQTAQKGEVAYNEVDTFVKENPWSSVGISAAVGLLVGILIARK